jgi:hypothetical protein
MADFDWDRYESQKTPEQKDFNWDAFENASTVPQNPTSDMESLGRGALQGLTLGFADEIAGGVESLFTDKTYEQARDESRANFKKAKLSNPGYYTTGELGGAVGTALVPFGSVATLGKAALTGASLSGLAGLGNSEADNAKDLAKDAAIGAGVGGAFGAAGYGLTKAVAPAIDKAKLALGQKTKDFAETKAFKSSGAMLKDFRTANDRGKVNELGRYMLDEGIVKFGDKVDDVAVKAAEKNKAAGMKLDEVYKMASERFKERLQTVGFDPKRDKSMVMSAAKSELGDSVGAQSALKKLSNYLDEVAEKHGDKPNQEALAKYKSEVADYLPKFKSFLQGKKAYQSSLGSAADDLSQPVMPGLVDDLQRTGTKPTEIELLGKPASKAFLKADSPTDQLFLPDMPTGKSEAARLFGKPGDANFGDLGGDAANRVGKRVMNDLENQAQLDFLNQNTKEMISLFGKQGEFGGLDLVPRTMKQVNLPGVNQGAGQLSMPLAPQAPMRPMKPMDMRNPMTPRRANEIKSAIDDTINYSRNPLSKEPDTEKAFMAARRAISNKIDEGMQSLGGDDLLNQLKGANKEYGMSKQIERIANDRVSREQANRMFGLTDTIAAGTGGAAGAAALGGPGAIATALAAGALNKAGRTYGNSTMAVGADKISKFLLQSRPMQQLAERNPEAFRAVVIDITKRLETRGSVPKAAQNELDNDSSTSSSYEVMPMPKEEAKRQFIEGN